MTEFKRREFLKAALAAMATTGVAGCKQRPRPLCYTPAEPFPGERSVNRAELTERLQQLAKSQPPRNLAPGAMCYSVVSLRYCLICGQRDYGYKEEDYYKKAVEELQREGLDALLLSRNFARPVVMLGKSTSWKFGIPIIPIPSELNLKTSATLRR